MSKFWCDKHESVVPETGCMQCIEEDGAQREEQKVACRFDNPVYPHLCMAHFEIDGKDHVAVACDAADTEEK